MAMPESYDAAPILSLPPAKLVEILDSADASLFQKAKACQRLAVIGDATAVPGLARLLDDPQLSHYARIGLEPMPFPEADAALRAAMERLRGDLLVGVINSIGRRRDLQALPMLAKLRHDSDRAVSRAAAAALSRLRRP